MIPFLYSFQPSAAMRDITCLNWALPNVNPLYESVFSLLLISAASLLLITLGLPVVLLALVNRDKRSVLFVVRYFSGVEQCCVLLSLLWVSCELTCPLLKVWLLAGESRTAIAATRLYSYGQPLAASLRDAFVHRGLWNLDL